MVEATPSVTPMPAQPVATVTNPEAPFPSADPPPHGVPPPVTDPVSNLDFPPVDDAFALELRVREHRAARRGRCAAPRRVRAHRGRTLEDQRRPHRRARPRARAGHAPRAHRPRARRAGGPPPRHRRRRTRRSRRQRGHGAARRAHARPLGRRRRHRRGDDRRHGGRRRHPGDGRRSISGCTG